MRLENAAEIALYKKRTDANGHSVKCARLLSRTLNAASVICDAIADLTALKRKYDFDAPSVKIKQSTASGNAYGRPRNARVITTAIPPKKTETNKALPKRTTFHK